MKWSIPYLKKQRDFHFYETVDLSAIKQQDKQIRAISPVEVSGYLVMSGDTFTFPIRIKGSMTLPCSRTLEDVVYPFDLDVKEMFRFNSIYSSEMEDINDDIHPINGEVIDLIPYIKERVLLEIPLQIFSENANSKEIRSGKDWELVTEEVKQNRIDPRLAELSKFFEKSDG